MISFQSLLAAAPLLALAVAQNIAFTSTPAVAEAGQSYNVTWGGGDGTGVSLLLRRGNPQDLTTVDTLASNLEDNYYVWEVADSLESGDDYALQITQGLTGINYSGLFTVEGGSSASNATSSTTSATTTSAAAAGNGTMPITSAASASGTGTAMSRNSTFSTATLTSSSSEATFGDMTSTRSSTSRTASASSSASETSAPSSDASIKTGSSIALLFGIVAAVMLQ